MKHMFTVVLLAGSLSASILPALADEMQGDEQALRKIEEDWANALVKGDVAATQRFVSPDWVLTLPDGEVLTKAQADADLKSGAVKFESFKLDELKVRVYGDTAVVHGLETEKSTNKGKDTSGQYRFTDTFIKRDGRWMAVATHVSKVEQK
jgi:ketosteroid isomerase-like protein